MAGNRYKVTTKQISQIGSPGQYPNAEAQPVDGNMEFIIHEAENKTTKIVMPIKVAKLLAGGLPKVMAGIQTPRVYAPKAKDEAAQTLPLEENKDVQGQPGDRPDNEG